MSWVCLHGEASEICRMPCDRCGHSCNEHGESGCEHGQLFEVDQDAACKCEVFVP